MTWIPRPLAPNLCYHVRILCNNHAFRFETTADYARYLELLFAAKKHRRFLLHHFTLMSTHVHLIITTPGPLLLNRIMQYINREYALDYHRRHTRTGHFWMNGYRCAVIDTDAYALTCMRYLDRNPMRAGLVTEPGQWQWSAHNYYAHGEQIYPLDAHESYIALGNDNGSRQIHYRDYVMGLLPSDEARDRESIGHSLRLWTTGPRKSR